ncbi:MAG: hypothetical protein M3247_08910 [Thermoproteota archaeon]|nr:hypothetical protein [Thermoproteota archaeon]
MPKIPIIKRTQRTTDSEPEYIRYRAVSSSGGRYDRIRQIHDYIQIYDLKGWRFPLNREYVEEFKKGRKDFALVKDPKDLPSEITEAMVAPDNPEWTNQDHPYVTALNIDRRYSQHVNDEPDYEKNKILLPESLKVSRYYKVSSEQLHQLEQNAREQGIEWIGFIAGQVPLREIAQATNQEKFLHPTQIDHDRVFQAAFENLNNNYDKSNEFLIDTTRIRSLNTTSSTLTRAVVDSTVLVAILSSRSLSVLESSC